MQKIRRHKKSAIRMTEKEVIAVGGLCEGCGSTHFAISAAVYLHQIRGCRVAYAELNQSHDIQNLIRDRKHTERWNQQFCYREITFYPNVLMDSPSLSQWSEYDAVVLDFGCIGSKLPGQMQFCTRRFIMMDAARWKYCPIPRWLNADEDLRGPGYQLLLPMAEKKEIELLSSSGIRHALPVPFQRDPFLPGPAMALFLERLF